MGKERNGAIVGKEIFGRLDKTSPMKRDPGPGFGTIPGGFMPQTE